MIGIIIIVYYRMMEKVEGHEFCMGERKCGWCQPKIVFIW